MTIDLNQYAASCGMKPEELKDAPALARVQDAAPDLLAALEAAVLSEQLDKHHDLMARAAIAKAKGGA